MKTSKSLSTNLIFLYFKEKNMAKMQMRRYFLLFILLNKALLMYSTKQRNLLAALDSYPLDI